MAGRQREAIFCKVYSINPRFVEVEASRRRSRHSPAQSSCYKSSSSQFYLCLSFSYYTHIWRHACWGGLRNASRVSPGALRPGDHDPHATQSKQPRVNCKRHCVAARAVVLKTALARHFPFVVRVYWTLSSTFSTCRPHSCARPPKRVARSASSLPPCDLLTGADECASPTLE